MSASLSSSAPALAIRTVTAAVAPCTSTAPTSIAPGATDSTGVAAGCPAHDSSIGGARRAPALVTAWSCALSTCATRGVHATTTLVVPPGATTGIAASHARASGLHGAAIAKLPARSVVSRNSRSIGVVPSLRSMTVRVTGLPICTAPKSTTLALDDKLVELAYAHTASKAVSTAPIDERALNVQRSRPGGAGVHEIISERVCAASIVNPADGAWTNAASQPGSAVMLPTTTGPVVSLCSTTAPDPEPPAGTAMTATSGSAWSGGGAAPAQRATAAAASTTSTLGHRAARAVTAARSLRA